MGCSQCRGHAAQVCSAPGCHDESAEVAASFDHRSVRPWSHDNSPDWANATASNRSRDRELALVNARTPPPPGYRWVLTLERVR